MPRDEVDPSLIMSEPRKRKLTSYTTNDDNRSADREATIKRLKETVKPTMTVQSGVENEAVRPPPKKTLPSISDSEPSDDDGDPASTEPSGRESTRKRKKKKKKAGTTSRVDNALESTDEEDARDGTTGPRCRQQKSRMHTDKPSDDDIEILESPENAEVELGQSQNDSKRSVTYQISRRSIVQRVDLSYLRVLPAAPNCAGRE
jgi:hypothetical protein